MLCFADGEPIKLPENLESLPKADHFPTQRHRWNTNEVSLKVNHNQILFSNWHFAQSFAIREY
jgi:hypothetical protein